MLRVKEMAFVKYNANKDNKNKGDCTIRSLSLAYNKSYEEVSKELRGQTYGTGRSFKTKRNLEDYISTHGYEGDKVWNKSDRITVSEFSDTYNKGTYLLLTGRGDTGDIGSPYSDTDLNNYSHIVCCIDGDVYDSWDSMNDYVRFFCVVESDLNSDVNTGDTRNTKEDNLQYAQYVAESCVADYLLSKDLTDYTINNYIGFVDLNTYRNIKWLAANCPESSCFFVYCPDEYTVQLYYLINTEAATEIPNTFRPKIDKKVHTNFITVKFSPKATNDQIDDQIEKEITSGIKKLSNALKKEQKFFDEVTSVSMEDKYPIFNIKDCYAGSKCTVAQIYDLLGRCNDYIQKNIISLNFNMDGYRNYNLKLRAKDSDFNNANYMISNEKGLVYFKGKNAKQLNKCYDWYCDDLKDMNNAEHLYNYMDMSDPNSFDYRG